MIDDLKLFVGNQIRLPFVRYFIMAGFVVIAELLTFILINRGLGIGYLAATALSNIVAIFLNWYLSIKLVFKSRRHKIHIEGGLIIFASVVGIGIQLLVAFLSVQVLGLAPFIGKILAIVASFFWSYWIRKKYIFSV